MPSALVNMHVEEEAVAVQLTASVGPEDKLVEVRPLVEDKGGRFLVVTPRKSAPDTEAIALYVLDAPGNGADMDGVQECLETMG